MRMGSKDVPITAVNSHGEPDHFMIKAHADECPVCHVAAKPVELGAYAIGVGDGTGTLQIVYQCPRNECGVVYVAIFGRSRDQWKTRYEGTFRHRYSEPSSPKKPAIPDAVAALSSRFVDVYSQAFAAETYRLREVAGPGYRKAFEVLIKDFIIKHLADDDEERDTVTKNTRLGGLVDQYFGKTKLAKVLHRVAWLANDEVHYAKRWEDKDLEDLHALLKIAMNMIESDIVADGYIDDMAG